MATIEALEMDEATGSTGTKERIVMRPTRLRISPNQIILMREVMPLDKWRFREGVARMSPRSKYLRFHNPRFELSEDTIDYLTQVDRKNHVAIGAIDCNDEKLPGVAVGRWVRDENRKIRAEVALTVIDSFQEMGIGTLLFAGLCHYARYSGVQVFDFSVQTHRRALIARFLNLGATIRDCCSGTIEMDMRVPASTSDLPDNRSGRYLTEALSVLAPSFA